MKPDTHFEALLGDPIGKGTTREVFAVKDQGNAVIKRSIALLPYSNLIEWMVWKALEKMGEDILGNEPNSELKELFAVCYEISETGRYLIVRHQHL